jgi:O-antigen ligase
MKAKQHITSRKSKQIIVQSSKVIPAGSGVNSMGNWLVFLSITLPVLYSSSTTTPLLSIRYLFLSVFSLLFVIYFYLFNSAKYNQPFPPLIKLIFSFSLLYVFWSIACLFVAINLQEGVYEIARYSLHIVLLLFVMTTVQGEATFISNLSKALVIASIAHSVIGIMQYYEVAFTGLPGANPKPYGLMGNVNLFASAQMLLLPFAFVLVQNNRRAWKYTGAIALAVIIFSLVIAQTRSAWLAATVIVLINVFIITRQSINKKKTLLIITVGFLFIISTITTLIFTHKSFADVLNSKISSFIHPNAPNTSSAARLLLWNKSFKLIKEHPVMGVGPGNWKLNILKYGSEGSVWESGLTLPSRVHNVYIQVATETGIPGAVLFITTWFLIVFAGLQTYKRSERTDDKIMSITAVSGIIGFAIDSMFSFPTERIEHSLYFTLFAGIIIGLYSNCRYSKTKKIEGSGILLITIMLVICLNTIIAYKKYNFEKHAGQAKRYRIEQRFEDALLEVELGKTSWVTLDGNGEPIELQSSSLLVELNNYDAALKEIKIANKCNPNSPRILTTMGVVNANLNNYNKAIECYQHALTLAPKYEVALQNLSVIYFATGNYNKCVQLLEQTNYVDNAYLLDVLQQAKHRIDSTTHQSKEIK